MPCFAKLHAVAVLPVYSKPLILKCVKWTSGVDTLLLISINI